MEYMTVVEGSSGSVQEQCNHLLATTFCAKLFGAPCGSPGALGRIDHKILCKTFLGFPCIDYLATASSRTSGFKSSTGPMSVRDAKQLCRKSFDGEREFCRCGSSSFPVGSFCFVLAKVETVPLAAEQLTHLYSCYYSSLLLALLLLLLLLRALTDLLVLLLRALLTLFVLLRALSHLLVLLRATVLATVVGAVVLN